MTNKKISKDMIPRIIIFLLGVAIIIIAIYVYDKYYSPNKIKEPLTTEYHIRVENFLDCYKWQIVYTNNNYITEEHINETFDLSENNMGVVLQRELFKSKETAIKIASGFKTYENCIAYNDTIRMKYDSLVEHRKHHPVPVEPKKEECKMEEILIY